MTRGVHQPAEEHGEQNEGDESADQRPVHGAKPYTSSDVKRNLLARRRERPRYLQPPLLTEDEPQLARRTQPVGMRRAEGRARRVVGQRTEQVLPKEALLAARLRGADASCCHALLHPLLACCLTDEVVIKADFAPSAQPRFPENAETLATA